MVVVDVSTQRRSHLVLPVTPDDERGKAFRHRDHAGLYRDPIRGSMRIIPQRRRFRTTGIGGVPPGAPRAHHSPRSPVPTPMMSAFSLRAISRQTRVQLRRRR
jgi:hypothetical protein